MKQRVMRSTLLGALALAAMPVAAQSWGPEGTSYSAQARVVSAVPIRETVASTPRQECWTEYSEGSGGNRTAGAVIGGIAGGLIGHQFGSGSGNTAATIAGALGGAAVGNEIGRRNEDPRAVERCRTVSDSSDRVVGYDVVYRFQGREFTARLPYDPVPELPVNVTVAPSR
jgi:uncharacterized protein YcfJ